MAPGNKGIMEVKDPALVFSGATKDWPAFKDAIQLGADKLDTTWLFEGGRALAEFFARQLKEKTGTAKMKATAVAREIAGAKNDSNHVPTSVDAYTDAALKDWFEDTDIATGLLLSLNKNRLTSLGSNFTDFKKLGFRDEDALAKEEWPKSAPFFFSATLLAVLNPSFFWGVQMEFSIQNEINSFHLFCNTIRLL